MSVCVCVVSLFGCFVLVVPFRVSDALDSASVWCTVARPCIFGIWLGLATKPGNSADVSALMSHQMQPIRWKFQEQEKRRIGPCSVLSLFFPSGNLQHPKGRPLAWPGHLPTEEAFYVPKQSSCCVQEAASQWPLPGFSGTCRDSPHPGWHEPRRGFSTRLFHGSSSGPTKPYGPYLGCVLQGLQGRTAGWPHARESFLVPSQHSHWLQPPSVERVSLSSPG